MAERTFRLGKKLVTAHLTNYLIDERREYVRTEATARGKFPASLVRFVFALYIFELTLLVRRGNTAKVPLAPATMFKVAIPETTILFSWNRHRHCCLFSFFVTHKKGAQPERSGKKKESGKGQQRFFPRLYLKCKPLPFSPFFTRQGNERK